MAIGWSFIGAIGTYSICGYKCFLFYWWLLVVIGGYSINGYWWLFY
jgi:hypothetical protein